MAYLSYDFRKVKAQASLTQEHNRELFWFCKPSKARIDLPFAVVLCLTCFEILSLDSLNSRDFMPRECLIGILGDPQVWVLVPA